jgi:hypothetical protein
MLRFRDDPSNRGSHAAKALTLRWLAEKGLCLSLVHGHCAVAVG